MTTRNLKMLSLLAVMAIVTATISAAAYAQTVPGGDGPVSGPASTGADPTTSENDTDARVDAIGLAIIQLQLQNNELSRYSVNGTIQEQIGENNEAIKDLFAEWDVLMPPIPAVEISQEDRQEMNSAMTRLMASDLPLLGAGIDPSTGMLEVKIDANNATSDIEGKIRAIATDVQLSFTYSKDYPVFQGSCNQPAGYCDPLIGGSKGEDEYWGKDCTVSIGAVRNTGGGTENGIVIPDHCNRNTSQYYQADSDVESHLVGSQTKDGGWDCDCDFVKSNSRTINAWKINLASSDYTLLNKSDLSVNDYVFMYGATSGIDSGRIVAVDQSLEFGGNNFSNLYKISGIDYTGGDSGAPIVGAWEKTYGGMNIGAHEGYNYGHEWAFLKSKLNLQ